MTVMPDVGHMREDCRPDREPFALAKPRAVVLSQQTHLFPSSTLALSRLIVAISDDIASG
jgi:hypothetical protein